MTDLVAKNPKLLAKDQVGEERKSSEKAPTGKKATKASGALGEIESKLAKSQWLGGNAPSKKDKEAFESLQAE